MKKALRIILEKVKAGTMETDEALELITALYKDDESSIEEILGSFESKARSFFNEASKSTDEWMEFSKKAVNSLKKDIRDFLNRRRTEPDREKDITASADPDPHKND